MTEQTTVRTVPWTHEETAMTTSDGINATTFKHSEATSVHSSDPEKSIVAGPVELIQAPARQRYLLLVLFVFAQFLDTYYNGALLSAMPTMAGLLDMTGGQAIWLISAYQMLMAAFLLIVSEFISSGKL